MLLTIETLSKSFKLEVREDMDFESFRVACAVKAELPQDIMMLSDSQLLEDDKRNMRNCWYYHH